MSDDRLHLIATNEDGHGWSLVSPQVPGLIYGRPTWEQLRKGMQDVLAFAAAPPLPWQIHQQIRGTSLEGVEYQIRVAEDDQDAERKTVGDRLQGALQDSQGRAGLLAPSKWSHSDDVLFIVVLGTDRLGWVFDQVDVRDGKANLIGSEDSVLIWNTIVSIGDTLPDMATLDEVGLTLDSTVADMRIQIQMHNANSDQVLVPA